MTLVVQRYQHQARARWNDFVSKARNTHFMFHRDYVEYHQERFLDHSLLCFSVRENELPELVAVLAANEKDGVLYSHQGLSFAGLVMSPKLGQARVLEVFECILAYARTFGFKRFVYKPLPHIYHREASEDDLYALFRCGAQLVRVDSSTTVDLSSGARPVNGKRTGMNRAKREGLVVRETRDFDSFFVVANARLDEKYKTRPVHTSEEMTRLAAAFPENIRFFGAYRGEELLAGCVVYLTARVCHAQYIASTEDGRRLRAVDVVIGTLVQETFAHLRYFDFGNSNEQQGRVLNDKLAAQKEEFGGHTTVQLFYELML